MKSLPLITCLFLAACVAPPAPDTATLVANAKKDILQAEIDFAERARERGVPDAFLQFAAEDAVMIRGNEVIRGKQEMEAYFDQATFKDVELIWSPDFVDVANSGDLGYTYGKYQFNAIDSLGQPLHSEGIFRTVWRKQSDGQWRFVMD